jgi:chitodextrinase
MKKGFKIFLGVLIVVIVVTAIIVGIFIYNIQSPVSGIDDVTLKTIDTSAMTMTFLVKFHVFNPNPITATLISLDLEIIIDGQSVGNITRDINQDIVAKDTTQMETEMVVNKIPQFKSSNIEVQTTGVANVKVYWFSYASPVDDTTQIDLTSKIPTINQPPHALILDDAGLGASTAKDITFDGRTSFDTDGTIVLYDWTFGDGTGAQGDIVKHKYSSSGQFTIQLTVTDNMNSTNTASKILDIIKVP